MLKPLFRDPGLQLVVANLMIRRLQSLVGARNQSALKPAIVGGVDTQLTLGNGPGARRFSALLCFMLLVSVVVGGVSRRLVAYTLICPC